MSAPVVLSYGLGTDSTAILLRWLHDPTSRDFDLADLVVVTAMTGDEWPATGHLVEAHVLPLLRAHGVRYVQVARAGASQHDGITVLADSRCPQALHLAGDYTLSDELLAAATVPQLGGTRKCSIKAKGWPLDTLIERLLGAGTAYRHVVGFEANEPGRALKDARENTATRTGVYPLIKWGWDRAACERYITAVTGAAWLKSACVFCPFALSNAAGRQRVLALYRQDVKAAVHALFIEHVSLAFNPRQGLNGTVRLVDLLAADGNTAALDALEQRLAYEPHAVFHVRRIARPSKADPTKAANYARSVRRVTHSDTREAAMAALAALPGNPQPGGLVHVVRERGEQLPATEEMYVVAPAVVADKQANNFDAWWNEANGLRSTLHSRNVGATAATRAATTEGANMATITYTATSPTGELLTYNAPGKDHDGQYITRTSGTMAYTHAVVTSTLDGYYSWHKSEAAAHKSARNWTGSRVVPVVPTKLNGKWTPVELERVQLHPSYVAITELYRAKVQGRVANRAPATPGTARSANATTLRTATPTVAVDTATGTTLLWEARKDAAGYTARTATHVYRLGNPAPASWDVEQRGLRGQWTTIGSRVRTRAEAEALALGHATKRAMRGLAAV